MALEMFWNIWMGEGEGTWRCWGEINKPIFLPPILQENYGQKEAEKVARVKALYEEMNLRAVFTQYEEHSYSHIMGLIEQYAAPLPPAIFLGLANKIYKRKK